MSCKICSRLSGKKKLTRLNADLLSGAKTLRELSEHYRIPVRAIRRHQESCLQGGEEEKDNYATLQTLLNRVIADLDSAQNDFRYSEDPREAASAAAFYGTLLKEARELVTTLDKLRSNEQLAADIAVKVLEPFRQEIGRMLLEEGSELKRELQSLLGPVHYTSKLDNLVKEVWRNMVIRFVNESTKLGPSVLSVLKDEKRGNEFQEVKVLAAPTKTHIVH